MNEIARHGEHAIYDQGRSEGVDIAELNRELRRELNLSHRPARLIYQDRLGDQPLGIS